ncbi:MAG: hypothetical protein ABI855_08510 [Bacteroidota bacterium]
MKKEPKEFLKNKTALNQKKFTESDCPDIFEELDFDTVYDRCSYFVEFVDMLDEKL